MNEQIKIILDEIQKVIIGKQDVIEKLLMSIFAKGHILLDDVPGVGKTSMALAISRALGLQYRRIQFTPDVLPSDITGFSIYNKNSGAFDYMPGVVNNANILLGDEINRTSSKTQSALLEAMEEGQVTVDGKTHPLQEPFIVIATQNNVGTAGTQLLPYAQLDRFLIRLSVGYPDFNSQMEIIRDRQKINPLDKIKQVCSKDDVLRIQSGVNEIEVKDSILAYITQIVIASRNNPMIELGISPRGAIFICRMAKAHAYLMGRNHVVPDDVQSVLGDVCAHRIILSQRAKMQQITTDHVLKKILEGVKVPNGVM
ncbi:MAG: MoxR family ATPase [Clostridiales bacterium]|nr:MoxR family ATPase [Clostridiales bacterium]